MSSPEDLTARARIRDAAITLFAERGIGPATIRDIAQAAGVSSGLVRHHFGSKEGLRRACDDYAMAELTRIRTRIFNEGEFRDQSFLGAIHPSAMQLQRYLIRSTLDSPEATSAMFARMVEVGEEWLDGQGIRVEDQRAYAAVLVAMQMGMFLMTDQLSAALGTDVTKPPGQLRMLRGAVEAFTHPLRADQEAAVRAVLDKLIAETPEE
ncbi:MAG TPA: helix-turn-helix domain-containing protein [Actinoplanes sp.]|nr:helix-turn-helix domain-containing protein [Actinoplanes sp.]